MVESRALEERLIKIQKMGEAYFWIGGPGEEAFGVPLGLLVSKGQGFNYDWLHLHYRCTPTLIAMGMDKKASVRLSMNRKTDPCTGGRNFSNHYCFPEWNVAPVTSTIETQYLVAIGTAIAQKRRKAKGITIVTGGDAGTAEGDFASSLVWSSRKGQELPMLIVVTNNYVGISTSYEGQHGETYVADRGKAFNMRVAVIDGNDPIESYIRIKEEMDYIRKTGKPVLLEASVSRLYGHSSGTGANREENEVCPLKDFEQRLLQQDILTEAQIKKTWENFGKQWLDIQLQVREEPHPSSESIWDHIYMNNENGNWRKY